MRGPDWDEPRSEEEQDRMFLIAVVFLVSVALVPVALFARWILR